MANWAKLQEQLTGLPVVKRAKHSIHFDKGNGEIVANFSSKPCHYEENGEWKALDTAIKTLEDGSLGAKGVPVRLNLNGLVRIINENNEDLYSQVTTRVGVFNSTTRNLVDYINLPVGQVQDDQLVKDTDLYSHTLRLTETGLREEIVIKSKPAFVTNKANLWLVLDTVVTGVSFEDGWLDQFEIAQMHFPPPTATDAEGREGTAKRYAKNIGGVQHIFTGLKFSELYRAAYPVTIDPDFAGGTADGWITSYFAANWAASRTDGKSINTTNTLLVIRQRYAVNPLYGKYRSYLLFDTSSIGSSSTVTQVNLKTYVTQAASTPVYIIKQDWSSQNPLSTDNMNAAFSNTITSDKDSASLDLSTTGAKTSGNLSTTWVSKTGTTYYALILDTDYDNTESTDQYYIEIASQNHATEAYRPVLSVTYTAGSTGVPKQYLHYARLRSN